MTINAILIRLLRSFIGAFAILGLLVTMAFADCAKDLKGEVYCGGGRCIRDLNGTVWCSRFYLGDARLTHDGRPLCGKGRCEKDIDGQIFCSSEVGGAVLKDERGHVRCYGRCERATAKWCENTIADSSG